VTVVLELRYSILKKDIEREKNIEFCVKKKEKDSSFCGSRTFSSEKRRSRRGHKKALFLFHFLLSNIIINERTLNE